METNVGPLCRGPVWMPITPKRGSFLHAESQRVTAHGCRTEDHACEARIRVLLQDRLAHALVFVVERERNQRMVLGDVGVVGYAVDRARGRVDESLHPGLLGSQHQRLEGVEIDRSGQILTLRLKLLKIPPLRPICPYSEPHFRLAPLFIYVIVTPPGVAALGGARDVRESPTRLGVWIVPGLFEL